MSKINEYIKKKWENRSQKELCEAIAQKKGLEPRYYKGYVNKWFNTEQEPGKDYLLVLSQVLNVSVESILRGEDIINEYGDRPTAYSAALSGDERTIDRLFGNEECDIWLHTTDEYGKSFVDYVIDFNNYSAFKIAIEKGYGYPVKANAGQLVLGKDEVSKEVDYKLAKMIIENDDLKMFIRAFGRDYFGNESPNLVFYSHAILHKDEILFKILQTTNILNWLVKYRCFSEIEKKEITHLVTDKHNFLQSVIDEIPSVIYGFNYLMNFCIVNKLDQALELMLNQGIDFINFTEKAIGNYTNEFEVVNYNGSKETAIQVKSNWSGYALGFVPYVYGNDEIDNIDLRNKAAIINAKIDKLRR